MNTKLYKQNFSIVGFPHRLVYMGGVDSAPPSPEHYNAPEKQSMEDKLNEVSAQSPGDIYNDTVSAGTAVKTKYASNTAVLASLANDDPLSSNPTGGGGGTTTTTTGGTTGTNITNTDQDTTSPDSSAQ